MRLHTYCPPTHIKGNRCWQRPQNLRQPAPGAQEIYSSVECAKRCLMQHGMPATENIGGHQDGRRRKSNRKHVPLLYEQQPRNRSIAGWGCVHAYQQRTIDDRPGELDLRQATSSLDTSTPIIQSLTGCTTAHQATATHKPPTPTRRTSAPVCRDTDDDEYY